MSCAVKVSLSLLDLYCCGRGLFYNRTTLKDEDNDDDSTATDNNTAVNSTAIHCTGINSTTTVNLLLNSTGVNSTAANNSLCGTDADTEKHFIGERLDPVVRCVGRS